MSAPDDGPSDLAKAAREVLRLYDLTKRGAQTTLESLNISIADFDRAMEALRAARSPAGTGGESRYTEADMRRQFDAGRDYERLEGRNPDPDSAVPSSRPGSDLTLNQEASALLLAIAATHALVEKLEAALRARPVERSGAGDVPERIWVEIARELADDGSHTIVDLSVIDCPDPDADYPYQEVVEYVRARPVEATPEAHPMDILALARVAARKHGYALAVHGSLSRDVDLVAVPWTEKAVAPAEVAEAIRKAVGGWIMVADDSPDEGREGYLTIDDSSKHSPVVRPHGRIAWSIYGVLGGSYIDLSVLPPARPVEATGGERERVITGLESLAREDKWHGATWEICSAAARLLSGRPVEVTGGAREAESVISELLRVEGWGNCASEWEMRRAYSAAYKRARDFMSPPGRPVEATGGERGEVTGMDGDANEDDWP